MCYNFAENSCIYTPLVKFSYFERNILVTKSKRSCIVQLDNNSFCI